MGIASAIILGLLGLGGSALSYFGAKKQAQTNQDIAVQNIQMQQQENEIARSREDNAVARRAADLEATGLSKTLAAGSAASSQLMTAPKNEFHADNLGQAALSGMQQGVQLYQSIQNAKLTSEQIKGQQASNEHQALVNSNYERKLNADIDVANSQSRLNHASAALKESEGAVFAEKHEKEMNRLISETMKNTESVNLSKKEREYIAQKIVNDIIHNENVSTDTQKKLLEMANIKLENDVIEHNLFIARAGGTNVGETPRTSVGRFFRHFNIANGNQAINVGFTPESLGY